MGMSLANRYRCSRGLRLLTNHEVHEEHEAKPILKVFVSSVSFVVVELSVSLLGAFFERGRFATQIGERFTSEMK
jgi:hypothetical protein